MIQRWTINILIMRLRGLTEKSKNGQKRHRTKAQSIKLKWTKRPKRENILILQQSRCTIPWSHDTGVDNQHSRHAITFFRQRKVKMDKSAIGQKHQRIKLKADKTPKKRKYFNTPTVKVYDPMITWYRGGQSTFSSCDHAGRQRKAKMDKSAIRQKYQRIKLKVDKTSKKRKYFNTPTIKVYDPMITWYSRGQSTFSSCDHVGGQRKAKMDKNAIGQKQQRITLKVDKSPKKRKYFNTPTIKVYDHMIIWYRGRQSTFSSCDYVFRREKSKNGQMRHRTEAPKDETQSGQNPQKEEIF